MTNTQVFNVSSGGEYPNNIYKITPITFSQSSLPEDFTSIFWSELDGSGQPLQSGGSLLTRDFLSYHKNPLINIINNFNNINNNFSNVIIYENVVYDQFSDKFTVSINNQNNNSTIYAEPVPVITISNAESNRSVFYFNVGNLRQTYKTPYEFYFFYVQLNDQTKNSYGYMIYPTKIFLKPVSVTNNNNKWQLKTKVGLLSTEVVHMKSRVIEKDAFDYHLNRLNNSNYNFQQLTPDLNSYKAYFYLYGSRTKVNYPVVTPSTFSIIPSICSIQIDTDIANIHPDSTFVAYSAVYLSVLGQIFSLSQNTINSNLIYNSQNFATSFILSYDYNSKVQTYQLVQDPLDIGYPLYDIRNTILNSSFDLNSGVFVLSSTRPNSRMSFNPNFPLMINYIADCYKLKTLNIGASSTLTNQQLILDNSGIQTNKSIFESFSVSEIDQSDDYIIWETTYPPYCYSYKIDLKDSSDAYMDHNHLMFYLKLSAINQSPNNIYLSAVMASDFNDLILPILPNYLIKFSIENTSLDNDIDFISNISCTYGEGGTATNYNLINPTFVPVGESSLFTINVENLQFRGVSFVIKATVITDSGEIDTFHPQVLNTEPPSVVSPYSIFLNTINEFSNEIHVDASLNVSASSWPARDLRNSFIKWSYSGEPNLSLNYIDEDGRFLSRVSGDVIFTENTSRVSLSGYGPTVGVVTLSSQKYSETASVSTNPNLFNYLTLNRLSVGPKKQLNNLNRVRTIELSAAMLFSNKLYNIPNNIPLNWTWEYDNISVPDFQPIIVEQPLNNNEEYVYGVDTIAGLVSSVKINVTPPYSKTGPSIRKINVTATINATQPPITGDYTFFVDDFPDPSLFNSDFIVYYNDGLLEQKIADTRENNNIVTRSEKTILNYYLSARGDIFENVRSGNLDWYFNDKKTNINYNQTTIDLTNPLSGIQPKTLDGLTVSSLKTDLVFNSTLIENWTSAHNVSATVNFYVLSSVDFYKPLQFLTFPQIAWIGVLENDENGNEYYDYTKVKFLSSVPNRNDYFTLAFMPTSYANTKDNSYTCWVSANKTYFNQFIFQNKDNFSLATVNKNYDLIKIPYTGNDIIAFTKGITIKLVAYNNSFYKEGINLNYIDLTYDEPQYVTKTHTITAITTEPSFTRTNTITSPSVYDNFFLNPRIRNYNDIILRYTPILNGKYSDKLYLGTEEDESGIERTNNDTEYNGAGVVSVEQYIQTSPNFTPALDVTGTITYFLSSLYWTASALVELPFTNTIGGSSISENLFVIKYGDPAIPLYAGEYGKTDFYLYAVTNLFQRIPPETFDNYFEDFWQYPTDPSLWKSITLI